MDEKVARRRGLRETVRDFLYGLSGLEFERQALEMRGSLETIFLATTLGDMLGLPIIPPIYSLRVLPYVVPHIATWKRRVLREREFSDSEEFHLHGVWPDTGPEGRGSEAMTEQEKRGMFARLKEILYGMGAHDMSRYALRTRASMEHLFILITMGDLIGVPILPPYYSLRLLPYVVPNIATWKRRMLREKDISDAMF